MKSIEKAKQECADLANAAKPLVDFLLKNYNPHAIVLVDCDGATVYSGELHSIISNDEAGTVVNGGEVVKVAFDTNIDGSDQI